MDDRPKRHVDDPAVKPIEVDADEVLADVEGYLEWRATGRAHTYRSQLFETEQVTYLLPGAWQNINDALLLLHTTVGCKFKTQRHLVEHDRARESHNRRVWTGVDECDPGSPFEAGGLAGHQERPARWRGDEPTLLTCGSELMAAQPRLASTKDAVLTAGRGRVSR